MNDLQTEMKRIAIQAKEASRSIAYMDTQQKNLCLLAMADALLKAEKEILEANSKDMELSRQKGLSSAMLDRLLLTSQRIKSMAEGVKKVSELPDPVGRILDTRTRPNGLKIKKIASPIGVIVIIFESRPNVTADAASLCFKSGNATILRGGKEALHSNKVIAEIMNKAGKEVCPQFPDHVIQFVNRTEHEAIPALLSQTKYVDLCIPRGGERLIRAIVEYSQVPVIKHYKGLCHIYVHEDANDEMAVNLVLNAKCQRPGVCNAIETLLLNKKNAEKVFPKIAKKLLEKQVLLKCDPFSYNLLKALPEELKKEKVTHANTSDWDTEYLDLILSVKTVGSLQEAIDHINTHGTGHSECIITNSEKNASIFQLGVDAAVIYWNASTRFTDGGEFGMGAEIGISTDKIGARGPMGLEELTSYKWVVNGSGQCR